MQLRSSAAPAWPAHCLRSQMGPRPAALCIWTAPAPFLPWLTRTFFFSPPSLSVALFSLSLSLSESLLFLFLALAPQGTYSGRACSAGPWRIKVAPILPLLFCRVVRSPSPETWSPLAGCDRQHGSGLFPSCSPVQVSHVLSNDPNQCWESMWVGGWDLMVGRRDDDGVGTGLLQCTSVTVTAWGWAGFATGTVSSLSMQAGKLALLNRSKSQRWHISYVGDSWNRTQLS